eukprot:14654806-Alexandrium_andersonii.AAC.1
MHAFAGCERTWGALRAVCPPPSLSRRARTRAGCMRCSRLPRARGLPPPLVGRIASLRRSGARRAT